MSKIKSLERIQVRAYFITLNTGADHLSAWCEAEAIELALAAKRSAAAKRGAETRRQRGMTATLASLRKPAGRHAALH